jgi:hypothetical protein
MCNLRDSSRSCCDLPLYLVFNTRGYYTIWNSALCRHLVWQSSILTHHSTFYIYSRVFWYFTFKLWEFEPRILKMRCWHATDRTNKWLLVVLFCFQLFWVIFNFLTIFCPFPLSLKSQTRLVKGSFIDWEGLF